MSRPLTKWQIIGKGLSLLEMTERERRMLSFLIENGSRFEWKSNKPNYYETLAFYMGWNEESARVAVKALMNRRWMSEFVDERGLRHIRVSDTYVDVCKRALRHKDARTAIGMAGWSWLGNPVERDVDAIIARAEKLTDGTLIKRIKHVLAELMRAIEELPCPTRLTDYTTLAKLIEALPPIDNDYLNARRAEEMAVDDDEESY